MKVGFKPLKGILLSVMTGFFYDLYFLLLIVNVLNRFYFLSQEINISIFFPFPFSL